MIKHLSWIGLFIILIGCSRDTPVTSERGFDEGKITYYNSLDRFNYDKVITSKPNVVLNFLGEVIKAVAWFLNTIFGYLMIAALIALLVYILFRYVSKERVDNIENFERLRLVDESKIDELDFANLINKALSFAYNTILLGNRFF